MSHTSLRHGNVYGPGRDAYGGHGVVSVFARAGLCGERPVNHGDDAHVSDVVEAHPCALLADGGGVFNFGAGWSRIVQDGFAALAQAAGYCGDPVHTGARAGKQRRSRLDVRRARHLFGRQAVVPFGPGGAQVVASLCVDAGTPAPGCEGPASTPGSATGQISEAGYRQ